MGKTDSITVQMREVMDEVSEAYQKGVSKAVTKVAKDSATKLKSSSPKRTGKYARGWSVKKDGDKSATVYNKTAPSLTHLLENGHVIRNKKGTYGRAPAHKHIAPVEQWAITEFENELMRIEP